MPPSSKKQRGKQRKAKKEEKKEAKKEALAVQRKEICRKLLEEHHKKKAEEAHYKKLKIEDALASYKSELEELKKDVVATEEKLTLKVLNLPYEESTEHKEAAITATAANKCNRDETTKATERYCWHSGGTKPIRLPSNFLSSYKSFCEGEFEEDKNLVEIVEELLSDSLWGEEWDDSKEDNNRSSLLKSIMISHGTEHLLRNGLPNATILAMPVKFIEEIEELGRANFNPIKSFKHFRDLEGDESQATVTKFFASRITCDCLQQKLQDVKGEAKMGLCFNCENTHKYKSLQKCQRCDIAHYCCRECQVEHWPKHKQSCKLHKEMGSFDWTS